ncbi:MAG: haloacid dehalogenase-like hydrolase [Spirochaetaceae bacterium]|nr:haloacid dehalogenase-like hydrolase [Spirochaetaceae bacterium]
MKTNDKPVVALIYDFDGTLSPGNMQEFSFIKALNMSAGEFWQKANKLSEDNDASSILCYMKTMLDEAKYRNISISRKSFTQFGKEIELFEGVAAWFKTINEYGKSKGLEIKHYINSSGLKEMIEGTSIAAEFEQIFACSFLYNSDGIAVWPGVAIDYTTKTQFIFKINKGIKEISDSVEINKFVPDNERPVPFKRMIYFGDGETDIPCMKLVKQNGGYSVAVYKPGDAKKQSRAEQLILDGRVNFVSPANYKLKGDVYNIVSVILDKIKSDYDFDNLLTEHKLCAEKMLKKC